MSNYPEVKIDRENKVVELPYNYKIPDSLIKEWKDKGYVIQLVIV